MHLCAIRFHNDASVIQVQEIGEPDFWTTTSDPCSVGAVLHWAYKAGRQVQVGTFVYAGVCLHLRRCPCFACPCMYVHASTSVMCLEHNASHTCLQVHQMGRHGSRDSPGIRKYLTISIHLSTYLYIDR